LKPAFTKIYEVRIVATVNNMKMTQDKTLTFDIVIGPDCSDDSVTSVISLSNTTYNIKPTAD
jgi:hypothetical protein